MRCLVVVACVAALASLVVAEPLVLATDGRTECEIVLPESTSDTMREWTEFLSRTLHEMTGADFPVVTVRAHVVDKPSIRMAVPLSGKAKYEEYEVRTQGRDVILAGCGERGQALAVRYFLTRVCGCRWYDGWTRKIPRKPTFVVPEMSIRRAPSFFYRRIFQGCGWGGNPKWKPARFHLPRVKSNPIGQPGDVHTFYAFSRDWPKDRLDLLSMSPKGRRRPLKDAMGPNFCLTNPDGRSRIKKTLRTFIEQDRKDAAKRAYDPPFLYCLSQNDCQHYYCKCPSCVAFETEHGTSGLLLDFVNDVARDIAVDYPDIILVTDAYAFAEAPPKSGMIAEPNVLVEVSRTKQNYYSPVEEDSGEPFAGYLKGWSKITKQLGVWDYWVFYWDTFPAPYHNVPFIKRNLKWYHDLGVRLARMESEQPNTASFRSLKEWLGNELLLDIDQDDTALIREFMADFYGAAAAEMQELMDLLTKLQKGQVGKVFAKEGEYDPSKKADVPRRKWLDADFYARAEDVFTRALRKVADADAQIRLNVMRERIPVDLSLLYVYDIIRPAVSRAELEKRYLANREAQCRLRIDEAMLPTALAQVRAEVDKLAGRVEKKTEATRPSAQPPRTPEPRKVTALANGGVRLDFDLTTLVAQPEQTGVRLAWTCREPDMANIHARYDKGDWNVFSGDAVDFYFSPYLPDAKRGAPLPYRFMMNPAGTSLTAYDDAKWRNRSISVVRTFRSDGWQSDWFIPYAALATYDARKHEKPIAPTAHWLFKIKRSRAATGRRETLGGGDLRLALPSGVIEPYARVALDRCLVEAGDTAEKVKVTAILSEMAGKAFAGRVSFQLRMGGEKRTLNVRDVKLEAGAKHEMSQVFALPQTSERFVATVAVEDEESRLVRTSRDLPITNPWVE